MIDFLCHGKNPNEFVCDKCPFFVKYKNGQFKCAIGSRIKDSTGFMIWIAHNKDDLDFLKSMDEGFHVNLSFDALRFLNDLLSEAIDNCREDESMKIYALCELRHEINMCHQVEYEGR